MSEPQTDVKPASGAPPSETDAQETVFLRKASGVIRVMSSWDGMYYGYLAAAGLYALVLYLFVGPSTFPNANIWVANFLAFGVYLAGWVVYAHLSAAMPRSGGDYVFESRLLKPVIGFIVSWGAWVTWDFFWTYLAAAAIVTACLSPMFSAIGVATGNHAWTHAASTVQSWYVITPIIFVLILLSTWIMIRGLKPFLRIQRAFMMPCSIGGLAIILLSFILVSRNTFFRHFDAFQSKVGGINAGGVIAKAHALGFVANHSALVDTLGFAVGLGGFYIWCTCAVGLLGEIKQANQVKTTFRMYAGAGVLQCVTLVIGLLGAYLYFGHAWLESFSWLVLNHPSALGGSWVSLGVPTLLYIPSLNLFVGVILFLCFLGPISQSLFNPPLASSRILLAQSFDRVLPSWFGKVNNHGAPYTSIWFSSILSIVLTVAIEFETRISAVWFWATFGAMAGFLTSLIAGTFFPYTNPTIYKVSPGATKRIFGIPQVTFFGVISSVGIFGMMLVMVLDPAFGLLQPGSARWGLIALIVSFIFPAFIFYWMREHRRREGIDVALAFKVVPRA